MYRRVRNQIRFGIRENDRTYGTDWTNIVGLAAQSLSFGPFSYCAPLIQAWSGSSVQAP